MSSDSIDQIPRYKGSNHAMLDFLHSLHFLLAGTMDHLLCLIGHQGQAIFIIRIFDNGFLYFTALNSSSIHPENSLIICFFCFFLLYLSSLFIIKLKHFFFILEDFLLFEFFIQLHFST